MNIRTRLPSDVDPFRPISRSTLSILGGAYSGIRWRRASTPAECSLQDSGPVWSGSDGSGSRLSAAGRPTPSYCSPEPFFSLLLSSPTNTTGAGEARFSGSASPAPVGTCRLLGGRHPTTVQELKPARARPNGLQL